MRFRHSDSDFVRAARQQDFLRQAKGQFSLSSILGDRKELLRIFSQLHAHRPALARPDPEVPQARVPVLEEPDPRGPLPGGRRRRRHVRRHQPAGARSRSCDEFKNAHASERRAARPADTSKAAKKARKKQRKTQAPGLPPGIVNDRAAVEAAAVPAAAKLRLPVYYPAVRLASGGFASGESDYPAVRAYSIRDRAKNRYEAYRMVLYAGDRRPVLRRAGHDLEGAADPRQPERHDARCAGASTSCSTTATRLRLVAWRTPRGVYWVSNTLSKTLTNRQMLAIARSLTRVGS